MKITRKKASTSVIGYTLVMTAAIMFSINGSLSRSLFDRGVTPLTLVEFRMFVGGCCLFSFLGLRQRHALKISRQVIGWLLAYGLCMALVTYTYFVAISKIPIAVVLVIQFTAPCWMALGVALWRRRLPNWQMLVALGLTLGGVVLLTEIWQQNLGGLDPVGLLFAFFALVTFIGILLLTRKVGIHLPAITGTAYGALIASIFWLCVQPPWQIPAGTWQPQTLILVVLVGIIGMALPFSMEMAGLSRLDTIRGGIATMLELPSSALVAYFWLGQALDIWQIGGCLLVVGGIVLVQLEGADK